MLHIVVENHLPGLMVNFLYILSIISVFFGIYVIISKNPVLSVLFLIGLFSSIALYLIMIGLNFIGLSYILVYIGAVSILFLFILMLINVRISELVTDNKNSILLAILTVICFSYCVNEYLPIGGGVFDIANYFSVYTVWGHSGEFDVMEFLKLTSVASVTSKSWDSILIEITHIALLGNILYTNMFILFIITSLILLLAMVGSIVTTVNKPLSKLRNNI